MIWEDTDTHIISSISFIAEKADVSYHLDKSRFPAIKRSDKGLPTISVSQLIYNASNEIPIQTVKDIPRPRNMFILVRSILSKLVRKQKISSNDDVSTIVSIAWKKHTGYFKEYYHYLSFVEDIWHETYYPSYCYQPKQYQSSPGYIDPILQKHKPQNQGESVFSLSPQPVAAPVPNPVHNILSFSTDLRTLLYELLQQKPSKPPRSSATPEPSSFNSKTIGRFKVFDGEQKVNKPMNKRSKRAKLQSKMNLIASDLSLMSSYEEKIQDVTVDYQKMQ